jgi:hypothetical protein
LALYHTHELLACCKGADNAALHHALPKVTVNFYNCPLFFVCERYQYKFSPAMKFPTSPLTLIDHVFIEEQLSKARRLIMLVAITNELKSANVRNPF